MRPGDPLLSCNAAYQGAAVTPNREGYPAAERTCEGATNRLGWTWMRAFGIGVMLAFVMPAGPARAQAFDCTKARSPVEKAICADPGLGTLDRQLAQAYAASLQREPGNIAALTAAQAQWLRQRDAACALPSARVPACLTGLLTRRLAALAPPPAASASASPPAQPRAPAPPPAPPRIPDRAVPPPAAALEQTAFPAAAQASTLLRVTSPGRFAITAQSATGTAIELVDMLSGPGGEAGQAGAQDGRLDPLLDAGVYKIRLTMDRLAAGNAALQVRPFLDAAPAAASPEPGQTLNTELSDLQQRSYWIMVPPGATDGLGPVRVEAAGRALADLRLWRGGTDLVDLVAESAVIAPQRGRPLTQLRLVGRVTPGAYLVTAYGGPAAPWADGATEQPFHVRFGADPALAEGVIAGRIGPMGSAVFDAPAWASVFRLDLPASAPVTLQVDGQSASLTQNSREPGLLLRGNTNRSLVTVSGAAGQAFTLRALAHTARTELSDPGLWWVQGSALGTGGDEPPPTVMLVRRERGKPTPILVENLPIVEPGGALRLRFNVRGPLSLLVHNRAPGELTVRDAGTDTTKLRNGKAAFELPADFLRYGMEPAPGKQGIADLVFGTGATPSAPAALPRDPAIPLGVQRIEPGQTLELLGNTGPGISLGLIARRAPVALAEGPLTFVQAAGGEIEVPVTSLAGGEAAVTDAGADVPFGYRTLQNGSGVVTLPASSRARLVTVMRRIPPPRQPDVVLQAAATLPEVVAGTPRFLDLARGERQEFALMVPEGGLFRVESTGRLRTAGTIGTAFAPTLDQAEANGTGENMLIQRWLRAGRYRVGIRAVGSAGHLGVRTSPAPLQDGPALVPGGSVRARLAAGTGFRVPVTVTEAGTYRLELKALGRELTARLNDAEGWPLLPPGPLTTVERTLQPGAYQLLVSPEAIETRVVARLVRVMPERVLEGHGPFPLPFEAEQKATWREPPGRDDARVPDTWRFALAGKAEVTLSITDGMVGELKSGDRVVARLTRVLPFKGTLEAGAYTLEAMSQGRNDRLDYRVTLASTELQPGVTRMVAPGTTLRFALAEPRVVGLTSFGDMPLKGVLRDAAGAEIARVGDRGSDWNIAISRPLPAGSYRLDLNAATPPDLSDVARPSAPAEPEKEGGDDAPPPDPAEPAAQTSPATDAASAAESSGDAPEEKKVGILLSLPELRDAGPAGILTGGGVHRVALAPGGADQLLLATASSSAELVLALEREDGAAWRIVALAQGTAPVVAAPGAEGAWRAAVWAVDGGREPIRIEAGPISATAQSPGEVRLDAVGGAAVARVALGSAELVTVTGAPLAGGWPGHALTTPERGSIAPQSSALWLVAPQPGLASVTARAAVPGQAVAVPVPAGGRARVAGGPVPAGQTRLWIARAGVSATGPDQPGLEAGQGMGVAPGAAVALGAGPVELWNAGGPGELRPLLVAHDLATGPEAAVDGPFAGMVPPRSTLTLVLPAGERQTTLSVPSGVAAWAGDSTVWGGEAEVTRTLPRAWTRLVLLNTGTAPAPVAVSWIAGGPPGSSTVVRRYVGSAGSFEVAMPPGTVRVAGDARLTAIGSDGQVRRGISAVLSGPGRVIVEHGPGAVALWRDGPGAWPDVAAQATTLPARLTLGGPAMALSITPPGPVLLRVRTTAPVFLRWGDGAPVVHAAGADVSRMVSGATVLRLDSLHDGPLSGTLDIGAEPVRPIAEGLGAPVLLPPGGTAAFSFQVARATDVGVGIRAEPDRAAVRLLAANGTVLGEGAAMLRRLEPGRYVIEATNPADAPTATLRPAVIGITPRGSGPPPDVAKKYLDLVGLSPKDGSP